MFILNNILGAQLHECTSVCISVKLSECFLWQDVDIDLKKSNQETLLDAGCLLLINEIVPSSEVPSLYTRIRSLQRLKVRLLASLLC